jgi:MarR family transcriptional regulator, lower aerobic nicotinate degradation pathway regulator
MGGVSGPNIDIKLGLLLRQAHQRAAPALNDVLLPLGLTGRHFGVMLLLDRLGTSTQRDLIAQTGSDKAGMARTVEDLDKLGYVSRTPSPVDRRVADLQLTPAGVAAFEAARRNAARAAQDLFAGFSPEELETLERLLVRFVRGPHGAPDDRGRPVDDEPRGRPGSRKPEQPT